MPDRIDVARHVNDVRILEASHHVPDRVAFADIGEELVPQPFALRCSRHQSCDVHELDRRRDDFLRRGDRSPAARGCADSESGAPKPL